MKKCQNCGNHVTEDFARVFFTDEVLGCLECSTKKELTTLERNATAP